MTPFDRSRPPQPTAPLPFSFPAFVHHRILPGVDAYVARVRRAPLVSVELILPRGGHADVGGSRGLASLTADLLDEGTQRRSGPELSELVERLGGSCGTTAYWDASYVASTLLAEQVDRALDLTAEIARLPTFPVAELERLRKRRLAEILRRRSSPAALVEERFSAALYGEGPYGRPLIGTEDDLGRLDRAAAMGFYDTQLHRAGATLIAAGDLDPDAVLQAAAHLLADWPTDPAPPPPPPVPVDLEGVVFWIVDRPQAAQTELRLGHVGPPRNHPDRIALTVLNSILGGKFTSRLNLNLRERHGYTYGIHSSFSNRLGPGPFQVSAAVATESVGAAVAETLGELRRLQEEPVSAAELADTVSYLEGVFPYTLQTVESVAQRLSQLAVYGLADDYFDTYPNQLHQVTVESLVEVARRHLSPGACAVVAVGPAKDLLPQLETMGPVQVVTPARQTSAPPVA
jgi:zinc protease